MAIGDAGDTLRRLRALLPGSWFRGQVPEIDAVLGGVAESQAFVYALVGYAKGQTKVSSSTDGFLELSAFDFFGLRFPRLPNELDAAYSARIIKEIFRERATRRGISQALIDLTGYAPIIQEPANPSDTWAWDQSFWDVGTLGSTQNNNQVFITAYRPKGGGIAFIPGWDAGFWDVSFVWVDQSMIVAPVTDARIYAAIAQTVAAGVTAWVMILNHP